MAITAYRLLLAGCSGDHAGGHWRGVGGRRVAMGAGGAPAFAGPGTTGHARPSAPMITEGRGLPLSM